MVIINQTERAAAPRARRALRLLGLLAAFAVGGFIGAYLVHDRASREWVYLSALKVLHVGNYVQSLTKNNELDTIRLEIGDREQTLLERSRRASLATGILMRDDEQWLKARLETDGMAVPIRLRLKGLLNDHRETDKLSFRIRMPQETPYQGMTAFSIQHPKTRGYLEEWAYRESLRAEDLLTPRFTFANVRINGVASGVYAVEEHLTSRVWLDLQERRDGIIVRLDDNDIWEQRVRLGRHFGGVYPVGFANSGVHEFRSGRAERNPVLRMQRDAAVRLLADFSAGLRAGSEVFDVPTTARFLALHELWSSDHVLGPPNARFYFNPVLGLFEPIGGDAEPHFGRGPHLVSLPPYYRDGRDVGNSVFWPQLFLQDPVAMEAYLREVERISKPEYLVALEQNMYDQETKYLWSLRREYPHIDRLWGGLRARQAQLRAMLDVTRTALAFGQRDADGVSLRIGNVLRLPVEILSIEIEGRPPIPAREALHDSASHVQLHEGRSSVILQPKRFDLPMSYALFQIPMPDPVSAASAELPSPATFRAPWVNLPEPPAQPRVTVRTRILGLQRELLIEARMGPDLQKESVITPRPRSLQETLDIHHYLKWNPEANELRIPRGVWQIDDDLIVPYGITLRIDPGATLQMGKEVAIVVRGPVRLEGTEDQPIVLEPQELSWPGMVVLQSQDPCTFQHVIIRQTRGVDRSGWFLTGGITFYESPVSITDCTFTDSIAEDSLNIIRSPFELRRTHFRGCISDSFDGDFTTGIIDSCTFEDISGDAIDVSGSRIEIYDCTIRGVLDKAVSAGEDSHVEINRMHIERAWFGIASKDLSFVTARYITIRDSKVGLAAFVKKPAYGAAAISAWTVDIEDVERATIVEAGSIVRLDGVEQPVTPVDVAALYEAEQERSAAAGAARRMPGTLEPDQERQRSNP